MASYQRWDRGFMFALLVTVVMVALFALPAGLVGVLFELAPSPVTRVVAIAFAPLAFSIAYLLLAGLLSVPFRKGIVPGKFPRDVRHPVYRARRLYGLCWTAVYYSGPLYQLALVVRPLRTTVLRLFGFSSSLETTFYADTWLRDLPLVRLGKGAYLSNRATIGTNLCLHDGRIMVDVVEVGENALIGHLTMVGPGAIIEKNAEVGVGVAFGIKARLGEGAKIGPGCVINHGATIGARSEIGTMSYVGAGAKIGPGIRIPPGSRVPDRAIIEDLEALQQVLVPAGPRNAAA